MLKRISHISLSLLLLLSTVGFAVSKHYCGDALVDVKYNANAETCCDDGSCCHNEIVLHQLDESFSAPQTLNVPDLQEIVVFSFTVVTGNQIPADRQTRIFQNSNSPPPFTVNEFLALIQVFLL